MRHRDANHQVLLVTLPGQQQGIGGQQDSKLRGLMLRSYALDLVARRREVHQTRRWTTDPRARIILWQLQMKTASLAAHERLLCWRLGCNIQKTLFDNGGTQPCLQQLTGEAEVSGITWHMSSQEDPPSAQQIRKRPNAKWFRMALP